MGQNATITDGLGGAIGTGSFLAAQSLETEGTNLSVNQASSAVAVGDINGDGILDLVTAGNAYDSTSYSFKGYATVRLGDGSGSFGAAASFLMESLRSNALKLADVNGDGVLDLITAGEGSSNYGYATVRLGDGSGSFGAATSFLTEDGTSYAVDLGDMNRDGVLDLITGGSNSTSGYATIRLGDSTSGVSPLLDFSLITTADARQALSSLSEQTKDSNCPKGGSRRLPGPNRCRKQHFRDCKQELRCC